MHEHFETTGNRQMELGYDIFCVGSGEHSPIFIFFSPHGRHQIPAPFHGFLTINFPKGTVVRYRYRYGSDHHHLFSFCSSRKHKLDYEQERWRSSTGINHEASGESDIIQNVPSTQGTLLE